MSSNFPMTEGVAEYAITLFPKDFKGVMVDIGAFDPIWINNSWLFEKAGWDVHCVEPNPNCIPKLKEFRKNVYEYACSDENRDDANLYIYSNPEQNPEYPQASATGLILHRRYDGHTTVLVKVRTFDWLMENEIKRDHVDIISIDVEMHEMAVLRGIDFGIFKPKVVIVENIWEEKSQHLFLEDNGYTYVNRIAVNDIYTRNDEADIGKYVQLSGVV